MKPLLMDFIGGKSALLAAMGPTGSGKTHTMFGSPREPGMVPLALRQIFDHERESGHHDLSRYFWVAFFSFAYLFVLIFPGHPFLLTANN